MRVSLMCIVLCLLLFMEGCNSKPVQEQPHAVSTSVNITFNTSDKSIESNGNFAVALEKFKQGDKFDGLVADKKPIHEISQSPYSNLGKFVGVKGRMTN